MRHAARCRGSSPPRAPRRSARTCRRRTGSSTPFGAASTPYLQAYPGQAWPVDSTVAVASLRLHDRLLGPRYGATSQSVVHRFLTEIDPELARAQYRRFRDLFVVHPLGFGPAVREYPRGVDGPGDVDSGPLVLGVSLSATVVTLGAARVQHDASLARALGAEGELVGVPVSGPHTRRYAFGALPVADAFLTWSATARPWVQPAQPALGTGVAWWWRLPWLAMVLAPTAVLWLLVAATRRRACGGAVTLTW